LWAGHSWNEGTKQKSAVWANRRYEIIAKHGHTFSKGFIKMLMSNQNVPE
jgi:hypothetical protein